MANRWVGAFLSSAMHYCDMWYNELVDWVVQAEDPGLIMHSYGHADVTILQSLRQGTLSCSLPVLMDATAPNARPKPESGRVLESKVSR